jgi:hypothetical protein
MNKEHAKLTTWEIFKSETGKDIEPPFDISHLPENEQKYQRSNHRLPLLIEHLRDGVQLDYTSGNSQLKYEPYFRVKADDSRPSGFALSYSHYGDCYEVTSVGSRFAHLSREAMLFVVENYLEDFENIILKK